MDAPKFGATHTPSWDQFQTVTLFVYATGVRVIAEVTPAEARAYAAEIIREAEIVEIDV